LVGAVAARAGDHAGAYAYAGEAIELGEGLGYVSELALAHLTLAVEDAGRGRHDDATRALATARRLIERAGTMPVAEHLLLIEAFCAQSRGEPEAVVALLEPRAAASGRSGFYGDALAVAPSLVEAYVSLGRTADAAELAGRYADANPPPAGPMTDALVARSRAMVAPDLDTAVALFEAAIEAHARAGDQFETARTRLHYGSRLRRAGQRVAARVQLRAARDALSALDMSAWVMKAQEELAATGETSRRRRAGGDEPLTSQETRVALLVARGLTNREVAASLFLSPKTVEHHLGSIFRKRGLRSRTELARVFAAGPPPSPEAP
jgi:DNA-binding CsgD family transcriptional regulator